jgi:hypothetical protein
LLILGCKIFLNKELSKFSTRKSKKLSEESLHTTIPLVLIGMKFPVIQTLSLGIVLLSLI